MDSIILQWQSFSKDWQHLEPGVALMNLIESILKYCQLLLNKSQTSKEPLEMSNQEHSNFKALN